MPVGNGVAVGVDVGVGLGVTVGVKVAVAVDVGVANGFGRLATALQDRIATERTTGGTSRKTRGLRCIM